MNDAYGSLNSGRSERKEIGNSKKIKIPNWISSLSIQHVEMKILACLFPVTSAPQSSHSQILHDVPIVKWLISIFDNKNKKFSSYSYHNVCVCFTAALEMR